MQQIDWTIPGLTTEQKLALAFIQQKVYANAIERDEAHQREIMQLRYDHQRELADKDATRRLDIQAAIQETIRAYEEHDAKRLADLVSGR